MGLGDFLGGFLPGFVDGTGEAMRRQQFLKDAVQRMEAQRAEEEYRRQRLTQDRSEADAMRQYRAESLGLDRDKFAALTREQERKRVEEAQQAREAEAAREAMFATLSPTLRKPESELRALEAAGGLKSVIDRHYNPPRSPGLASERPPNRRRWMIDMANKLALEEVPAGKFATGKRRMFDSFDDALAEAGRRYDLVYGSLPAPAQATAAPAGGDIWSRVAVGLPRSATAGAPEVAPEGAPAIGAEPAEAPDQLSAAVARARQAGKTPEEIRTALRAEGVDAATIRRLLP